MASTLKPEEQTLIEEEVASVDKVVKSLEAQLSRNSERLSIESARARELTSNLVAASRDEDKAMLASDEAVSHALRDQHTDQAKALQKLVEKPYFARFVVEEERNGKPIQLEYKLGVAGNTDCRIIDWRRAPVAKLYYEYKEGEEYAEEVQGQEREGTVILRNSVEIDKGELQSMTCRYGTFERHEGEWVRPGQVVGGGSSRSLLLKNILPLITPEQFQTITEEATTAILIQGIAGSGKTTVALHRLAWLLHEDNAGLNPDRCAVIVLSNVLKSYISQTLPSMGITGVPVLTYADWVAVTAKNISPELLDSEGNLARSTHPTPLGVLRLKSSMAFLSAFEKVLGQRKDLSYSQTLSATLEREAEILAQDDTRLLTSQLFVDAREHLAHEPESYLLDHADDALFMRYAEIAKGGVYRSDGARAQFEHLVVDEVQDLSAAQLASLIEAVPEAHQLTLVGDTAQQIGNYQTFPGWDRLRERWALKDEIARYISLEVSHRSTLPIMRLADRVQHRQMVKKGREGRRPIWFHTKTEEHCLEYILKWLKTGMEKYPHAMTAVVCPNEKVAKYALSLLEPTFGSAVRLGDNHSFSFEEGIVVTSVRQVKGLEFTNVLLWDASGSAYPANQLGQNLLYIAITRAEENLAIATWRRPSKFLPHIHSKLVRGYDFTIEEDDDAQRS